MTKPQGSMMSIVYCTPTSPVFGSLKTGAQSGSGVSEITMPDAWRLVLRFIFSSLKHSSKSFS